MRVRSSIVGVALLAAIACDKDPSEPDVSFPAARLATAEDTLALGRQAGIRFIFPGGLLAQSALDPANFVVTNLCSGLRVPGAIRLLGDTLVFTPSQALPYLSRIGVRIQNLEALNGAQQPVPVTQTFVTEAPPVSDQSWELLNSPSNDFFTGLDFAETNASVGFALANNGSLYRTDDGGRTFIAAFKRSEISFTNALHQFGLDTVYFTAALQRPAQAPLYGVLRSIDAGVSVDTVSNLTDANLYAGRFHKTAARVRGVVGGQGGGPRAFVYREAVTVPAGDPAGTLTAATGITVGNDYVLSDVAQSQDTTKALLTTLSFTGAGAAFYSTNGGQSYTRATLPANTRGLQGTGFIDNTNGFLLGDSSTVIRINAATGAVQALGAAQGIPQGSQNAVTGETITYTFLRAAFQPGGQRGYIVGYLLRRRPGQPDQLIGVILQSTDGGQTFTRQAIEGTPNEGLGFPPVVDVRVKANGLAALSGLDGLLATRQADAPTQIEVCSFIQP